SENGPLATLVGGEHPRRVAPERHARFHATRTREACGTAIPQAAEPDRPICVQGLRARRRAGVAGSAPGSHLEPLIESSNSYCKMETTRTEITHVGVDVSKHHLDVHIPGCPPRRDPNTAAGIAALVAALGTHPHPRVICEASGGYEGAL